LHLAKHPLIRPRRITDEVQEALMLRRNVPRTLAIPSFFEIKESGGA
jgi:hypothetical protein